MRRAGRHLKFFPLRSANIDRTRCFPAQFKGFTQPVAGHKVIMIKKLSAVLALGIGIAAAGPVLAAGDPAAGSKKTQMCQGCHGIEGFRTAYPEVYSVPKLGGQNAGYIVAALKAYKVGDRKHPSMRSIASTLSDQDMADLAAYYSSASK